MKEIIPFEDFKRLDLRIGTVLSATKVAGSDKLIQLEIDLGEEKRQIIAGIGQIVDDLQTLVDQQIPLVVNLQPKKIMGLVSQGMILAVDVNGQPVLLHPEKQVPSGVPVS